MDARRRGVDVLVLPRAEEVEAVEAVVEDSRVDGGGAATLATGKALAEGGGEFPSKEEAPDEESA